MSSRLSLVLVALLPFAARPVAGQHDRTVPAPAPAWQATPVPQPAGTPIPVATSTPRPTPTPIPPGEVRVKVLVTGADGKSIPAAEAVAWFPGLRGAAPAAKRRMASREKRFEPRILAVPKGSAVAFPNFDKIFHNVFSLSETSPFDLGLYRNGASRETTFEKPGVVRVYCNIHPQMAAWVVVLDGSLYAQTGKDGLALVSGVPAGRQILKVWEERGGEWSGTVVVPAGGTVEVTVPFDVSKWREQPHKNKHGKDYPPPDDDENRY